MTQGWLDLALFDELADLVTIVENDAATLCPASPATCREPLGAAKAKLSLANASPTDQAVSFTWGHGAATAKAEFGNPLVDEDYELCLYEGGALVRGLRMPGGQTCPTRDCWKSSTTGFNYMDNERTPDGLQRMQLRSGSAGKGKIGLKGDGLLLDLPDVGAFDQVVDVQIHHTSAATCFGASFTPPFKSQDSMSLRAVSDAP